MRRARTQLHAAFRACDEENEGVVEVAGFELALTTMNDMLERPLTPSQLHALLGVVPREPDGRIDYNAFLLSFNVQRTPM